MAYDGLQTPAGKVDRALGGAATYIGLSASYFTKASLVAVVGEDFAQEDLDFLASRGIGLEGVEKVAGKTFFWAGVYSDDMNDRTTLTTELNVFADFDPKLPDAYKNQQYLMLGNIQPGLQRSVKAQIPSPALTGGDTMNYWINDYRGELLETLKGWDFLLINDSEARLLSGESNLKKAAAAIRAMGPSILVIKRGEYGATLFHGEGHSSVAGYLLDKLTDPTGAGDCFAGGFIGYLASRGVTARSASAQDLARATVYGSVMGSFCCEEFGVERFRTLTRGEIDARFAEFQNFSSF